MVSLPIPASNCFKILLENQGEIITQEALLTRVWNERGMNVNANTLHQNISLLRKALARIDGGREVIKTIPKRGFTIPSSIAIERKESIIDAKEELHEILEINHTVVEVNKNHVEKSVDGKKKGLIVFYAIGIFSLMLLGLYFFISPQKDYFSSYVESNPVDKCRIFANVTTDDDGVFENLISKSAVDCRTDRWVYITGNHVAEYPSLIACRNRSGSGAYAKCQSFYFLN
ncbi:winged helix-turn-helix domain-containing protein [Klebsiella spallanzanii]